MKEQIDAFFGMVIHPKSTLRGLPDDRFFLTSFLISLYFTYGRVARKGTLEWMVHRLDSYWGAMILLVMFSALLFITGSALIVFILGLFRKQMTIRKAMNIAGYSSVPRLLLSIPASILIYKASQHTDLDVLIANHKLLFFVFSLLGALLLGYSTYLLIWALVKTSHARET